MSKPQELVHEERQTHHSTASGKFTHLKLIEMLFGNQFSFRKVYQPETKGNDYWINRSKIKNPKNWYTQSDKLIVVLRLGSLHA